VASCARYPGTFRPPTLSTAASLRFFLLFISSALSSLHALCFPHYAMHLRRSSNRPPFSASANLLVLSVLPISSISLPDLPPLATALPLGKSHTTKFHPIPNLALSAPFCSTPCRQSHHTYSASPSICTFIAAGRPPPFILSVAPTASLTPAPLHSVLPTPCMPPHAHHTSVGSPYLPSLPLSSPPSPLLAPLTSS